MTSREYDGYLTLFFSVALIALSFALTYLFVFIYILFIAIKTGCNDIKADHIVLLGKKLVSNRPDKDYRLRLNRALTIAAHRINTQIHILGGITGDSTVSESIAGKNYLEENKIQTKHIYIEEISRDTLDNMKQLKTCDIITDKHIALITNRYHLARASIMAQGFGYIVQRCAAEDVFKPGFRTIAHLFTESFFLHWYLTGRYYAKLTRNQRMLARIH
jgi:uncharacterized SAM-binding protein YcdF (DUF218 family)